MKSRMHQNDRPCALVLWELVLCTYPGLQNLQTGVGCIGQWVLPIKGVERPPNGFESISIKRFLALTVTLPIRWTDVAGTYAESVVQPTVHPILAFIRLCLVPYVNSAIQYPRAPVSHLQSLYPNGPICRTSQRYNKSCWIQHIRVVSDLMTIGMNSTYVLLKVPSFKVIWCVGEKRGGSVIFPQKLQKLGKRIVRVIIKGKGNVEWRFTMALNVKIELQWISSFIEILTV